MGDCFETCVLCLGCCTLCATCCTCMEVASQNEARNNATHTTVITQQPPPVQPGYYPQTYPQPGERYPPIPIQQYPQGQPYPPHQNYPPGQNYPPIQQYPTGSNYASAPPSGYVHQTVVGNPREHPPTYTEAMR